MAFRTIMVHLELGRSNNGLLEIAGNLAQRCNASLIGIAGCQPVTIPYNETYISGDIIVEDRKEIERQIKETERQFRAAMQGRTGSVEWRSIITFDPLAEYIAHEARAADLVITGPDIGGKFFDSTRRVGIADLVMQAGRPVFIVPHNRQEINLNHIVVGWKGTRESRRAIADALPLMKLAGKVSVVQIAAEQDLPSAKDDLADVLNWLKRHDIIAKAEAVAADGEDSLRFADLARERQADLVVAGAYGHSRMREWALGGVTLDFLLNPDRCVLVSH
jgi:nucleotide-binding universal stress UspA family protein